MVTWGKDPLGAVLIALEFVGPCRFAGWAAQDMPELGLLRGDPVAMNELLLCFASTAVAAFVVYLITARIYRSERLAISA